MQDLSLSMGHMTDSEKDLQVTLLQKTALKKMIAKDKSKIKRYLVRVIDKLRNSAISN